MSEVGVEIVKTEETEKSGIKYLNINMSDDEVKRNPDIVRLCADAGILEYVKPKTGRWVFKDEVDQACLIFTCNKCGEKVTILNDAIKSPQEAHYNFCPNCGKKMITSRCADCNHYGKLSLDCSRCDDDCSMYEPQESEDQE